VKTATVTDDVADTAYADIVDRDSNAMIYQSPRYLAFLKAILPGARLTLIAVPGQAAMPVFVLANGFGTVVNALPYYGSHGDLLCTPEADDAARAAVFAAFADLCRDASADAVNIVGHPLRPVVEAGLPLALSRWDEREGQISALTPAKTREDALEATLAACNGKTRNLVRKGLSQGFAIGVSEADEDWQGLAHHHRLGIEALGGRAKPETDFIAIRQTFGDHARLYVARSEDAFAGAVLVLRHRDWAEYFTPVSVPEFRSAQVVPALIAAAISDARMEGARHWNWGGTWGSQDGVRHFKEGWGAQSHLYGYFGALRTSRLARVTPEELAAQFPRFYVRPYSNQPDRRRS
jgi:hypothetical protein